MHNHHFPEHPEPFWRDSVSFSTYPKLQKSIKVDVGIVGGGIVGITAAYMLAKQNVNVALLEADTILNGTTGHTTAKITAQHGLIYHELINHFGEEKALLYYQAAIEAKEIIKQYADQLAIDCDFEKQDAYIYTNSSSYLSQLEDEKRAYDQLKIPSDLTDSISLDIPVKSALVMKNQAQYHPLKYLKALVDECTSNGVDMYEQTTAIDVEYNKHPAIITKDGHRVTCRYVIVASHFPFYDGQGLYPARMYAERSYIIGIETDQKYPGGMYISAESPTRSIRTTPFNGRDLWLIGGGNHKTGQGKSTMDYYKSLQQFAETQFNVSNIVYRWSAQDLITLDKVPYIGPITEKQHSVFVATGFRKWGMTNGTIAAKLISDLILEKESPYEDLYSPSRFQADPSLRKFTRINTDVAKHMIKGKLDNTNTPDVIDQLSSDEATVTRINGKRTGVYKDKENNLHMVDTTCTHMKCEVEWNSGERTWDCPCHGSRFSYTGDVIEGPAKRPLKSVDVDKL